MENISGKKEDVQKILKNYNQEHLLMFYDELDDDKKGILLDNILQIDFELMNTLYKNSFINDEFEGEISPLPYYDAKKFSDDEIDFYTNIGIESLKRNEFAVVTLAGGQGTRLGHSGPKGTFELSLVSKKKSLFEILCDMLKKANSLYNTTIPWYVMTSKENKNATINFFKENNYFNYPIENVAFFMQEDLPLLDTNGKVFLEEMHIIKKASNGNGDMYSALKKYDVIGDMKNKNIKWIFTCGIDNVLVKLVDPFLLGLTIYNKKEVAAKSFLKTDNQARLSMFCKINNKPDILIYPSIAEKLHNVTDGNGDFLYRDANALCHLFSINALEKCSNIDLPYHRAFKKNVFINEEGMKQVPEKPNSFKFEKFIFDTFPHFDDILLLRIEKEEEFAPIKDLVDMNAATKLYNKQYD